MLNKTLKQLICKHKNTKVQYQLTYEVAPSHRVKPFREICLDCDKICKVKVEKMEEILL